MKLNNLFSNEEKVAVSKALKGESDKLAPGVHTGTVTLRIDYSINKGVDTEAAPTVAILSKATLAKALVMSGIQADNFIAALVKIATEAMDSEGKVAPALTEADERVIAMIERIEKEVSAKLPKMTKSGATKVKAEVSRIETTMVSVSNAAVEQEEAA